MGNKSAVSNNTFGYSWGHYSVNPNSTTPLVIRIGTTNVIDSNIQNLLVGMLTDAPRKRYNIDEVKRNPWFRAID